MNDSSKIKHNIRQHFVPQFYLRNFGDYLYSYDKKNGEKFCTTSKNLAFKSNFYGGEIDGVPSLEKLLSKLEGMHSTAIRSLIENKSYYSLEHIEKIRICEFMSLQYLRTEQVRMGVKRMADMIFNTMLEPVIPPELTTTHNDSWDLGIHLSLLKDFRQLAILFFNMKFVLLENNTTIPFWTSDNPLAKQNEYDQTPFGTLGIVNAGIEIHLPLTSNLALLALDPNVFASLQNHRQPNKLGVIRENFLQIGSSNRFVYSQSQRFHLITSMLKDNPEYKDENRNRCGTIVGVQNGITKMMISTERNLRWPIDSKKPILNKLKTWASKDFLDKVMNNDNC